MDSYQKKLSPDVTQGSARQTLFLVSIPFEDGILMTDNGKIKKLKKRFYAYLTDE
ncbi:MAG: hypothetical protein AAFO04_10115 [Cyanobacteria bacterium J06592_8]